MGLLANLEWKVWSTDDRSAIAASQLAEHVSTLVEYANYHHADIGLDVEHEVGKPRDVSVAKPETSRCWPKAVDPNVGRRPICTTARRSAASHRSASGPPSAA